MGVVGARSGTKSKNHFGMESNTDLTNELHLLFVNSVLPEERLTVNHF